MEEVPSRFEQLWTPDDAAAYLGVRRHVLYEWRYRGYGPPSYRLGNQIRYRPEEVVQWVDTQSKSVS